MIKIGERLSRNGFRGISILLSLYVLVDFFRPMSPMPAASLFMLFVLILAFLQGDTRGSWLGHPVTRGLCGLASIAFFGYLTVYWSDIEMSVGTALTLPVMILGIGAIVAVMIATARLTGWALVCLSAAFFAYSLLGGLLPPHLGGHRGYDFEYLVSYVCLTENGILGLPLYTVFKYVFLFVMFGKVLEQSGALNSIIDFAKALLGRFRGGPALVSVLTSALFGTASGSAVANVMVDGYINIPLMKSCGFKPHVAGAIEAATSNGGQIMPPVMGTAAFLMSGFLGVSYLGICKAALIPAILYYAGIAASICIYSRRPDIKRLDQSEFLSVRSVIFRWDFFMFVLGLATIIGMLLLYYSPMAAALCSMVVITTLSMFTKRTRMTVCKVQKVLEGTAKDFLPIGVAVGCIGVLMGTILLTGLGSRLAELIFQFSGGNLLLALPVVMFIGIILGCGLPTTVVYLIMVITLVPGLLKLDVPPLSAHLFVFYSGMMSMVTPPVALAAYAAATIASSDFWKTGVYAAFVSVPGYLLPFCFVLNSYLLMEGNFIDILVSSVTALIGVILIAASIMRQVVHRIELLERILCFAGGVLLVLPIHWLSILGLVIAALSFARPVIRHLRKGATLSI